MALNRYSERGSIGEQYLLEDLIIESIQHYGTDVYYLPRELVNRDDVFLDDTSSLFARAFKIEVYIENTDGFEGDRDLFTKFGVEIRDAATFIMSRRRWKSVVVPFQDSAEPWYRPREGDLLFLPLSKSMFQIMKVEDESPFYQLKNLPTFRMMCELFEYNDEDFDTELPAIDDMEQFFAYQYVLTLDSATGTFYHNNTVSQINSDYTITGEVVKWDAPTSKLYLAHVGSSDGEYRSFQTGVVVGTADSSAYGTPSLVEELQKIQQEAQNDTFGTLDDDFIDWSESNVFGDPE